MLTILMCSKVLGNTNSKLLNTLHSLNETVANPARVNVLIKFDDNDLGAKLIVNEIQQRHFKINTQWIFTARAGGYNDLHRGYNDLILISPPETQLYWVIADDVTFTEKIGMM